MAIFTKTIIRCFIDVTDRKSFKDVLTGGTPEFWNGTDIELQLAFGIGADANAQLLDIANFDSVSVKVMAKEKTGVPYIEKTVSSGELNQSLTLAQWKAGTGQHVTISIPYNETQLPLNSADKAQFWMVVHGVTSDSPIGKDTYGGTILTAIEDGVDSDEVTPPVQPGNVIPEGAMYNGDGDYILAVTQDRTYRWTASANDARVLNDGEIIETSNQVFISNEAEVTLQGTPNAAVTAVIRPAGFLTPDEYDARYLKLNGGNKMAAQLKIASADGINFCSPESDTPKFSFVRETIADANRLIFKKAATEIFEINNDANFSFTRKPVLNFDIVVDATAGFVVRDEQGVMQVVAFADLGIRLKDGQLQFLDESDGLWRPLGINNGQPIVGAGLAD